jgi:hypothetical protein
MGSLGKVRGSVNYRLAAADDLSAKGRQNAKEITANFRIFGPDSLFQVARRMNACS